MSHHLPTIFITVKCYICFIGITWLGHYSFVLLILYPLLFNVLYHLLEVSPDLAHTHTHTHTHIYTCPLSFVTGITWPCTHTHTHTHTHMSFIICYRYHLTKSEGTCSRLATEKLQVCAQLDSLWSVPSYWAKWNTMKKIKMNDSNNNKIKKKTTS